MARRKKQAAAGELNQEEFLSVEEVATQLHVSQKLVRTLMLTGQLRWMRVGRLCRIKRAWLTDYTERERVA